MRRTKCKSFSWDMGSGKLLSGRISFIYVLLSCLHEEFVACTMYIVLNSWYIGCDLCMISALSGLNV